MVQARALSIKRDSLSLCKGGVALDLPRSVWPKCWGERARRELVLLAQCESHIRAEDGRQGREGPGVSCCLGYPGLREGPQFRVLWGKVPQHPDRLTAYNTLMDSRSPNTEIVQSCWDHCCVQLRTTTASFLPADKTPNS